MTTTSSTLVAVLSLSLSLAAHVAASPAAETTPAGRAAKTNFLIVLADDLGYGDLGCYGHPKIQTPTLDRLAAQGVRLTSCYAAAPVCSPSRAGLLTGRNPNRFGVYDWIPGRHPMHMRADELTIAELLRRAGCATGQFGKWHCNGKFNMPGQPQPNDHGFEYWFATQNNAHPDHHNPSNFVRNGEPVGATEGYSCEIVAQEAIGWMRREQAAGRPFFAYVCFHEPHEQVASPPELVARYPDVDNPNQALYFANVTNIDRAVGRLLAALDDMGAAENTFVLFTSDNGPETLSRYPSGIHSYGSPGPLRGMKLHLYEGGIRVPAIIRWPGRTRAGQVVDEPVSSVDLLPTFCAIAGIDLPRDRPIDGSSILPIFDGRAVERRTPLFWFYYLAISPPRAALRDGDWKLVARLDAPTSAGITPEAVRAFKRARLVDFELYNLREDVGEKQDRAAAEPERVKAMGAELRRLLAEVQADCPVWPAPQARATTTRPRSPGG